MHIKDTIIKIIAVPLLAFIIFVVPYFLTFFDIEYELGIVYSCLGFVVLLICAVIVSIIIDGNREQKHKGEIEYNLDKNEIKIYARNSYVANGITIEPETYSSLKYNPAEITYTATTIGPITNGHFDIKSESLTAGSSQRTGTYRLNFGNEYSPIYTIVLSEKLVKEAKKNVAVSNFLSGDRLILRHLPTESKKNKEKAKFYSSLGTGEATTAALNIALQDIPKSKLNKDECKKLLKWIAGKK